MHVHWVDRLQEEIFMGDQRTDCKGEGQEVPPVRPMIAIGKRSFKLPISYVLPCSSCQGVVLMLVPIPHLHVLLESIERKINGWELFRHHHSVLFCAEASSTPVLGELWANWQRLDIHNFCFLFWRFSPFAVLSHNSWGLMNPVSFSEFALLLLQIAVTSIMLEACLCKAVGMSSLGWCKRREVAPIALKYSQICNLIGMPKAWSKPF